jgi:hypothetical protein
MGGLLNTSSVLMCPHGGSVQIVTTNVRAKASGDLIVRASDTFLVAGCPFTVGPALHPCVQVRWVSTAAEAGVAGDFALTTDSVGMCVAADQAVQGTVLVVFTQPRATAM